MRLRITTAVALAAVTALSSLATAPSAMAEEVAPAPMPVVASTETKFDKLDRKLCREIQKQDPTFDCEMVTELELGPIETVLGADEVQQYEYSSSDFTAMTHGTITCRAWSMERRPRDGTRLWQISQRGRHCWDGTYAWYGTYRGTSGYHQCGYDDYNIFPTSTSCTRSGNVSQEIRNTYSVRMRIPYTTLTSTFDLTYRGGRTGGYVMYGL